MKPTPTVSSVVGPVPSPGDKNDTDRMRRATCTLNMLLRGKSSSVSTLNASCARTVNTSQALPNRDGNPCTLKAVKYPAIPATSCRLAWWKVTADAASAFAHAAINSPELAAQIKAVATGARACRVPARFVSRSTSDQAECRPGAGPNLGAAVVGCQAHDRHRQRKGWRRQEHRLGDLACALQHVGARVSCSIAVLADIAVMERQRRP